LTSCVLHSSIVIEFCITARNNHSHHCSVGIVNQCLVQLSSRYSRAIAVLLHFLSDPAQPDEATVVALWRWGCLIEFDLRSSVRQSSYTE